MTGNAGTEDDYPKDLDQLRYLLEQAGGVDVLWEPDGVTARGRNDNSFAVTLWRRESFTVGFDGWHEEFDDLETAIRWFLLGLSPDECRLRVTMRGGSDCKWTVQFFQDGEWMNGSSVGLLLAPFWKRASIVYRRNLVTPPPAPSGGSPGSAGGSAR